ncbi:GAF domain-containing protein [Chryseolinea sp. T2]|uniref:GAF domain-containing protein n=1 Tax=Chryseolinea sp. T2 TaxID=3129255 RepID=UPI003076AA1F
MTQKNYDSDFCGKVPIHLTNLIQSYGVLVIVETERYEIVQVSENASSIFEGRLDSLLRKPLASFISANAFNDLRSKLNETSKKIPGIWELNGQQYLVLIHNKGTHLLIEIELEPVSLSKRDTFIEVYQELKYAMLAIESTSSIEDACKVAAFELKRISGFDKVMVYSFDSEWNGTVMAESREADMEAYMGFTFPASDIPKQARDLYLKNPYRLIPDKDYVPVKLFPVINPLTKSFLDLSDCNLRSVVAVHIEYLTNMGVTASMSTRILHQGKLWGLIACHHKVPKFLSYEMCSIFEMLSTVISAKISSIQNEQALLRENAMGSGYAALLENVYKNSRLDEALLSESGLMEIFNATGVAISRNGRIKTAGITPLPEQLEELLLWLHTKQLRSTFHTDSLSSLNDYAVEYREIASGMLVIPVNYIKDSYVLIFRPEKIRTINWGGNPDERITFDKDEKNYHPRNSFKQWQQLVSGIAQPWRDEEVARAETLRSFIYEYETSGQGITE